MWAWYEIHAKVADVVFYIAIPVRILVKFI